ncbi:methyltransferase domain-containing protein [Acinetobacter sp. 194]|uniref:class I SAM-dependent methyltransferase n=1 Tax=Acinetobacter shaoyimingii TaxID=2715164 RepID=UPI001409CD74|nr:methyltransferase domain-containing protein [Acinetobacter shaoyimingii]NHB56794.1 methyltransferase domain-containing protein [Acinetobacter shaoyimingii]
MKDLFSEQSHIYQQARPSYPHAVIAEILKHVPHKQFAWDCGAGSGQFTQLLSPYFEQIVATDLSAQQLKQAHYLENVSYQIQHAEKTSFHDQTFDLVTVAQAIHWFDFDAFYAEVQRTLKPDGVLAVIGYGLIQIQDVAVNRLLQSLYYETLKGYWDAERKYIDEGYATIPFPFDELHVPRLKMHYQWSVDQFLNYLSTWSALKKYKKENQQDPLKKLAEFFQEHGYKHALLNVEFPIFLRIGRLKSSQMKKNAKRPSIMRYSFKS